MTLYAAYGPSLDPSYMARLAPASPVHASGWLTNWRLTFAGEQIGWDGSLVTVVEDQGHQVFVMIYDVPTQDERALDAWEGVDLGLWRKLRVRVDTMEGQVLAWLYVIDDYEGGLPSAHYLETVATAAEVAGAPHDYVQGIRLHPCRSLGQQ